MKNEDEDEGEPLPPVVALPPASDPGCIEGDVNGALHAGSGAGAGRDAGSMGRFEANFERDGSTVSWNTASTVLSRFLGTVVSFIVPVDATSSASECGGLRVGLRPQGPAGLPGIQRVFA